jgi:3-oxoacyl-[acyl-carrier-protein] synthase-1
MSAPSSSSVPAQGARLVITATGAVTSVGYSAAAAYAAIRAGITRPRKVGHFRLLDSETQNSIPLMGHPLHGFTDGFLGMGRWMRLARGGLLDLLSKSGLPGPADRGFWSRTGLVVVTPSPDDEVFDPEGKDGLDGIREDFLRPLRDVLGLPVGDQHLQVMAQGAVGTAALMAQMLGGLSSQGLERLLVVAADSQLDPTALQLLGEENRLKTDDYPVGFMPGEAGVCLLLESPASARRRGAPVLAGVSGCATAQESNHLFSGGPNLGVGLSACIREVLGRFPGSGLFEGDVYLDLNGETWRAQEWGTARVRLKDVVGEPAVHLPCASVGDVGAASGALGVCLAAHALSRGHTRTGHVLVVSSSHWGNVGCVSLHPGEA